MFMTVRESRIRTVGIRLIVPAALLAAISVAGWSQTIVPDFSRLKNLVWPSHSIRDWFDGGRSKSPDLVRRLNTIKLLDGLQIKTGQYAGAFRMTKRGYVNWYFGNLALLQFLPSARSEVRQYLDAYIRNLEADYSIQDARDEELSLNFEKLRPDSHDSYAGTFLALASQYARTTGDWDWFKTNRDKLVMIAQKNLIDSIMPDTGLVRVFQMAEPNIAYLMDNCEAAYGLRQFANALQLSGAGAWDFAKVNRAAYSVSRAIVNQLYDRNQGWRPAIGLNVGNSFYPDATCQAFPILFEVQTVDLYLTKGWQTMNQLVPDWYEVGKHDFFPWMLLGVAAFVRGEKDQAMNQMRYAYDYIEKNPQFFTLNELGFWHRLTSLASQAQLTVPALSQVSAPTTASSGASKPSG